jgi:hypothetical protein
MGKVVRHLEGLPSFSRAVGADPRIEDTPERGILEPTFAMAVGDSFGPFAEGVHPIHPGFAVSTVKFQIIQEKAGALGGDETGKWIRCGEPGAEKQIGTVFTIGMKKPEEWFGGGHDAGS